MAKLSSELAGELTWAQDNLSLVSEECGTLAFTTPNDIAYNKTADEYCLVKRVDLYGPFEYGGVYEEVTASRVVGLAVGTKASSIMRDETTVLKILPVKSDDGGDWLFVKTFAPQSVDLLPVKESMGEKGVDELTREVKNRLDELLTAESIPYGIHRISEKANSEEIQQMLSSATQEMVTWRQTDNGGYEMCYER